MYDDDLPYCIGTLCLNLEQLYYLALDHKITMGVYASYAIEWNNITYHTLYSLPKQDAVRKVKNLEARVIAVCEERK